MVKNMKKTKNIKSGSIGKRIHNARKSQGYTSNRLSEVCDISAEYLRQIEADTKIPSLFVFIALCNALEVSSDYLLQDHLTSKRKDMSQKLDTIWKYSLPREQGIIDAMLYGASNYVQKHKQ